MAQNRLGRRGHSWPHMVLRRAEECAHSRRKEDSNRVEWKVGRGGWRETQLRVTMVSMCPKV